MKKTVFTQKKSLWTILFFTITLIFSSCSNFNNAAQTSKDIKAAIEYNNASSYTIRVDSDKNRGVVKSPAGGEAQKKVTDEFTVAFEPLPDYEFLIWKIIDSKTKTEYQNGEYLQLSSITSDTTACKFVKAPPADVQLTLFAVVAKRPRVIAVSPQSSDTGIYRDAKIRVVFDKKIEEKSIYFDQNEIDSLKSEYGLTDNDFVNAGDAADPKFYAYTLEGEKYYKNIYIVNQKTEESILNYYGVPYFEDPVTLIIPPDADNPPPGNTKITVTLDRNFSYLESAKSIMLKEDYVWLYSVNSKIDKDAPEVMEELLVDDKGGTIAPTVKNAALPSEPSPLFKQKIKMYINIKDPASGPYNTFKIKLTNAQNANLVYEKEIGFDQLDVEEAFFGNKTVSGGNTEYTYTEYTFANDIPDGNYKLNFIYYDKNINPSDPDNYYYVRLDREKPNISNIKLQAYEDSSSLSNHKTALQLSYACNDYDHIVAKYKRTDGSGDWSAETPYVKGQDFIIPDLTYGVNYTVQAVFYDASENTTTITQTAWTKLCEATSLNITAETIIQEDLWHNKVNSSTATLSWTSAYGEFDSYTIKYKDENGNVSSINNVLKTATTYTITGLTPYKNYTFWITTIQNDNTTSPNGVDSESKTKKMPIHIAPIDTIEFRGEGSGRYLYIHTPLRGDTSSNYKVELYYSTNSFSTDNPPNQSFEMSNFASLGYGTKSSNAKLKTSSSPDGVFEMGQKYWFAIKVSDKNDTTAFSWSSVESFDIVYTVENLSVDYVTGTKCKIIWEYPSGTTTTDLTTNIYLIDSNGDKTKKVTYSGKYHKRFVIENLNRNTTYTVEVELIYNNVSGSLTVPVTTKDIAFQTGFAKVGSGTSSSGRKPMMFEWNYPSDGFSPVCYIIQCKKEGNANFGIAYSSGNETAAWDFQNNGLKVENGNWNYVMSWKWITSYTKLGTDAPLQNYFWYQNGASNSGAYFYSDEYYDFLITGYIYDSATNSAIEVVSDCITVSP